MSQHKHHQLYNTHTPVYQLVLGSVIRGNVPLLGVSNLMELVEHLLIMLLRVTVFLLVHHGTVLTMVVETKQVQEGHLLVLGDVLQRVHHIIVKT